MKILITVSNYYPKISNDLLVGAKKKFLSYSEVKLKLISVPGIFEIPVIISKNINLYDAFLSLGCVIKGETPHFDFISSATINAIMNLSIDHKKPIGNGIITCLNKKQALIRSNPKKKNKGGEAAEAVLSVLGFLKNDSK
tara:strand:- start:99 stop:518 length:420 start_codon:yes stop_codon:yes gene_type:complete